MNFERKWCHECSGIQLFGEHKGKACCSIMSRILKDSETGEPIRAYMDKGTTRNMCRNLGEGCPILTLAEVTETQHSPAVHMAAVKAEKPETIEINGRTYCTKSLKRYDEADKAEPIRATTLTSLVDYIKESREELRDRMIIQVVNATKVLLYSGLLPERDRETLFEVNALLPRFEYGREYDQESFLVSMQACFAPSEEREDVTKVASNIVSTQEATFSDDGISQQVVMKTGVTKKENAIIPNPVRLIPYRTFLEVEQPESEFVFRITEGRGGAPAFKLVSADGGRWEAVAVDNVKSYLVEALADIPNREQITIIA